MLIKFIVFYLLLLIGSVSWAAAVTTAIIVGGGALFAGATIGVAVVAAVATYALSSQLQRLFTPSIPGRGQAQQQQQGTREQIPPSTVNSIPVVYGDAWLGGQFIDAALSQNQKVMYYVITVSSISPNGQFMWYTGNFYYGDRKITFDTTDLTKVVKLTDGSGNETTNINGKLFINLYKSDSAGNITSQNAAPDPDVVMGYNAADKNTVPSNLAWNPANRKMFGLAFAIVKLVYNQQAQTTGLQTITFKVGHHLNNTGVAKPGDVWYDYMTNTVYGAAMDPSIVDATSAAALNAYSDQYITFTNNQGDPSVQQRYRINGVVDTTKSILSNINDIVVACDSWLAYDAANGKWSLIINKAESASYNFDDENIVGDISVSTLDINQSYNEIEAKFPSKLNKDISDYVYLKTPAGLLYPNEPVNKLTTTFDMVNDSVQALYLANRILEQAREDLIVKIRTNYIGTQVAAGDVVTVTNSSYGWTNKLFRVTKVNEITELDGNLYSELQLNEYNAQVYDDKNITEFSPAPNSLIPDVTYFGTLNAPTVVAQLPNAAVPSFAVDCVLPASGQVLYVNLYYTTVASPTTADWVLWTTQTAPSSEPFTNGSTLRFPNITLPTNLYYFAFNVSNNIGQSELSATSASYNWLPNPSTSAVAGTFVATFSPAIIQVPYDTTPDLTGIAPQLYGTTAGGSVDFVPSQTDTDPAFVNDTWRIGGSSTTGYGDIVLNNITVGNPSDGGFYALFPQPTAMSAQPAYIEVPVRYKSSAGTVVQGATAILQLTFSEKGAQGDPGTSGDKTAVAYLYQWSTVQPGDPNGTSSYSWTLLENTGYTGGNGWTVTVPANPGTPSIKLWQAAKGVSDTAAATNTTVDWTSGFTIADITQNGAAGTSGTQAAAAIVYQWALTIPAGPSGTSTYTWSTGTFTPTPAGWTLTPGTSPTEGYTLWEARVSLVDSATASTSSVNWSTATISAVGYSGTAGTAGSSARVCFARVSGNPTPVVGTITTSGPSTYPSSVQSSSTWGFAATWGATDPDPSSTDSLYQSDGIYSPSTNQTVWSTPYISSLKVGTLSAITVNTGGLTVTDYIRAGSSPAVSGSTMTGSGFTMNSGGTFAIGNSSKNMSFNGSTLTMNGDLVVTGNIVNDAITSAWTGSIGSSLSIGSTTVPREYTFPTFTVPSAGKLVTTITAIFYSQASGTNFKVQAITTVQGESPLDQWPIHYLNLAGATANFLPIGPNNTTSGSCQVWTTSQENIVTSGETIEIFITASPNANNTAVFLLDCYYVAVLYKR